MSPEPQRPGTKNQDAVTDGDSPCPRGAHTRRQWLDQCAVISGEFSRQFDREIRSEERECA
jgi:hypothetical protein